MALPCAFTVMGLNSLFVVILLLTGSDSYYFEFGYDHYYTYSSKSNLLDMHNVTTIMKFRVRPINQTSDGATLHQLYLDSFVQNSDSGYMLENPMKWNLSKSFLFKISPDGLVSSVLYHSKEDREVVSLKKVLSSILSARKVDPDHGSFTATETDHAGHLDHSYEIHKKEEGFMVQRFHQSTGEVKRHHNKTLHYDHRGTIHFGVADDTITLHNDSKKYAHRKPLPGEASIGDSASGEFPTISSNSKSHVKLTLKRKHPVHALSEEELIEDSLLILMIEKEKQPMKDVNVTINNLIRCIHSHENHFATNRTDCVTKLREILTNLHDNDYQTFAEGEITTQCKVNDTVCETQKKLFVDLVARKGDNFSQSLVVKHFLRNEKAIEDHVHRCLFHCIALKEPTMELIEAVEELCFGVEDSLHGGEKLGKTQRRACLTLGAIAKVIQHSFTDVAHRLVHKLESWLGYHNETHSKPIIARRKRSVTDVDPIRSNHVVTKMVLLHAIGNAGMERSRDHIVSYMKPNQGAMAWRRAAVHGLRHFSCNESARALMKSSIHDHSDIVRDEARVTFSDHPKSKVLTPEYRDIVLSKHYTYTTLMRVKRGIFEASFDNGIHFAIRIPGVDWVKTIGTSALGASFGLVIKNQLELELKPLQGHFEIDVYDTAFAEAHVGLINLQIDIFRALLCYKGHIGYDLNVLKDFGINDIQDILHIFDKITKSFVDPVKDAVETFKKLINNVQNGGIQKMFNALVDFVKHLPDTLKAMIKQFVDFVIKTIKFGGIPWVDKIKHVVKHVRDFIEELQDDIMGFYHSVVDAITVQIPYIGKKLMDAISSIVSSMKYLLTHPMQALTGLSKSVMEIKMSISMFIGVKNTILDALFFLAGKSPFWQNFGDELELIIEEVEELIESIFHPSKTSAEEKSESDSEVSDGIVGALEQKNWIKKLLKEQFDIVMAPLKKIMKLADPFIDAFKSILNVVHGIKEAYLFVKDTVNKAKSTVQKLFGPKFHIGFPTHRRDEKAPCGQGVWPTTSGNIYKTTGVDVMLGKRSKVVSPVNGMVYRRDNDQVLIEPSDEDFLEYEIIIDNVVDNVGLVSSGGTFVEAGKKIGKAGVSKCQPNFIHVAVRKRGTGEDGDYMDPSPYLDRLVPVPQWIEECNDHYFKHIGSIFESGELDEEGAQELAEDLERGAEDRMEEFKNMEPENEPPYRPEGIEPNADKSVDQAFKDSFGDALSRMGDLGKMLTGKKPPNILDLIDLNKYTISRIKGLIKPPLPCKCQLDEIIVQLSEKIRKTPNQHPASLSVPNLRMLLKNVAGKLIGDTQSMVSKLLGQIELYCPAFIGTLAKGFGHSCTAHKDCQGIKCGINMRYGSEIQYLNLEIRVDSCKQMAYIITEKTVSMPLDGMDHYINLGIIEKANMNATLIVSGEVMDDFVVLSAASTACSGGYMSCTQETEILIDSKFSLSGPCKEVTSDPGLANVEQMTLEEFQVYLSFYHLLNKDVLCLFNNIRDFLMNEMFKDPRMLLKLMGVELDQKMDFCVDVDIPVPPLDIDFFPPQHYLFMVGPVPLSLGFGAGGSIGIQIGVGFCFLSLKARVTVTPWVGGRVWGSLNVDIGFARGGIKLIGYLMETKFPITGSIGFSKFPLDVMAKMDLILTPVRFDLRAYAEIFLFIKTVTVFDASIWKYKAPVIHKNIFTIPSKGEDKSPPDIQPSTINSRRKREGPRGCLLKQIKNRSPTDTAFLIEMSVQDEVSQVKLFYAIGTQKGGTNVVDWTEMGGQSLLVPITSLPNSIPLYWTVKAGNSNGLYAYTHCMLTTFDNTVPDGRVDPSYSISSHPLKLSGTVVVFDDSQLVSQHSRALGFSPGQFGSEFKDWEPLTLKVTSARAGESTDLKYFSIPKDGKLTSRPFQSMIRESPLLCARECLKYATKCVAFDYEFHSENCDLQEVVQGPKTKLRISGTYKNYERLGIGHTSFFQYDNLDLTHGTMYFMNAEITNVLGYKAYLTSQGTMVDFTPPTTGPLGEGYSEEIQADGCRASVSQKNRCIEVTWKPNHRFIIDGKGARTVFNGHRPLEDQLYTISNHYTSANFDGFEDEESGIYGYTWAVGRKVCGTDVVDYNDPHAFLFSSKYWTYSGYQKDLHLEDGQYYVTVQALNNVVYGGALVTTVCHSTPFTVDTTPPTFGKVNQIMYDEDFDILGIYFKGYDELSKVARVDFGLGKTKYDVQVRSYSPYPYVDREDTYIGIEELGLEPGVPAWIRLRLVNNVELFTAGHGDDPILIDRTPPVPGTVLDGSILKQDLTYQANDKEICAQWITFYDPESGINQFVWGVGTTPGKDDIVTFHNFTHSQKQSCADVALTHNTTYYSTVVAFNSALNVKNSNTSSDGVLIDITPPLPGWVKDGVEPHRDLQFSAESATKRCNWDNYSDPESHIAKYNVRVTIRNEDEHYQHVQHFGVKDAISFTDHSMPMKHNDIVKFEVEAYNGAGLTISNHSDGFKVDHTPPEMSFLRDTDSGCRFQSDPTSLLLNWEYRDRESGIKEYRYFVYKIFQGMRTRFWPEDKNYETMIPTEAFDATSVHQTLSGLTMESGVKYSVHVTALNQATMSAAHESEGVIIDTSPPTIKEVRLCKPLEDEELTDDGQQILHDDPESLTISWRGRDSESGISNIYIGLGETIGDLAMTGGFLEFGNEETIILKNLMLDVTSETGTTYYVSMKAINGAGLESVIVHSKEIIVQKANIPGEIYDGREEFMDSDYKFDKTSIAMTFGGFESEACNIVGYEWAVGSQPYYSDVLPYTDYGIVLLNSTHGQGQIHLQLYEDSTYYISVRAETGHGCGLGKDYIVSCSDGIKVDSREPRVTHIQPTANDSKYVDHAGAFYQSYVDSLDLSWNISDSSPVSETYWSVGSLPYQSDIKNMTLTHENRLPPGEVTLTPGNSVYLNIQSTDDAGNTVYTVSQSVTADLTPPKINGFSCTEFISTSKTLVTCSWDNVEEIESVLDVVYIDISSDQETADLATAMVVARGRRDWTRDFSLLLKNHTSLDKMYVVIHARNVLGLEGVSAYAVTVDHTPPSDAAVDIVTRTDTLEVNDVQQCQIPWMYIEINVYNLLDADSGIDRVEIALGYAPEQSDIRKFAVVDHTKKVFIDHLSLRYGSQVYATARVYNKAGLYTLFGSDPVAISPYPKLTVTDGAVQGNDLDYQSKLNVLQGYWDYSDPCPILKAEWKIEDLTGKVLQDYQAVPGNGRFFYNDELTLNNGYMYIVWVRVTDALYRTFEAQSDGITVRIQTPDPGLVIDGLKEDQNYQQSTSELYVSWNGFGKPESRDPIQKIIRYEVAIGNDRRYAKTRANVHYYIDVGLNQSHIFTNLNLTAKTVTYYMTVRAYSEAGSYEEAVSNGIKVGYRDGVIPGTVETTAFQSDIHSLSSSWSGFESDIGLKTYIVGAGTSAFTYGNDTFSCDDLTSYIHEFDVYNMTDIGLNTYYEMSDLQLHHKELYYIAVIAVDESNMCAAASGSPIMVDTSPPKLPPTQMAINNLKVENVSLFYVTDVSKLNVEWDEFVDEESGISFTDVDLMTFSGCPKKSFTTADLSLVDTVRVLGERKAAFYDLFLTANQYYMVRLKTVNQAGLMTLKNSTVFSIDTTPPQAGSVHIGTTWEKTASFQYSLTTIQGWAAIAHTENEYICPSQRSIIQSKTLLSMMDYFDPSQVKVKDDGHFDIGIGYNRRRKLVKGGVKSSDVIDLRPGNYSVTLRSCRGLNMMSTISFATVYDITPTNFTPPAPKNFEDIEFNISRPLDEEDVDEDATTLASVINSDNVTLENVTTQEPYTTSERFETTTASSSTTKKYDLENITYEYTSLGTETRIGFGVTIIGEKQRGARVWDALFWARDVYKSVEQWFTIENDPSSTSNDFTISVNAEELPTKVLWNLNLLLNGEVKSKISGLQIYQPLHVIVHTWNKDDYKPPITDLFEFFHSSIDLADIRVPIEEDKPCLHGSGFYDPDSSIKEIWVGVSDSLNNTDNVAPMTNYADNCLQCKAGCEFGCDKQCGMKDFDLRPITLKNLQLKSSIFNQTNATQSVDVSNSSTYYMNVKMVNFAGQETMATSNGIMVDITPPACEYLRCSDPKHSIDEPTEYLGSNDTIGAFWSCDEDISQIQKYVVSVGSTEGGNDMFNETSFGVETKISFSLNEGTYFQHNKVYFVTLEAFNVAGLSSRHSCHVTVQLYPPLINDTEVKPMFRSVVSPDSAVYLIDGNDQTGVAWNNPHDDVDFYEWSIGTSEEDEDILPKIKVGVSKSGNAAIIKGHLWLNNTHMNKSVSEFVSRNWTGGDLDEVRSDSTFLMEPGRCMHQTLYAEGHSHLASKVTLKPKCIKRAKDVYVSATRNKTVSLGASGSGPFTDTTGHSNLDISVTMTTSGSGGGVIVGKLNSTDINHDYGTAASAEFNSFIVDPEATKGFTSRYLRQRLVSYVGQSFFLSPAPKLELNELHIIFAVDSSLYDINTLPILAVWIPREGVWYDVGEMCGYNQSWSGTKLSVKACPKTLLESGDNTRTKRSTGTIIQLPHQFSLFKANNSYFSSPPVIDVDTISIMEDTPLTNYMIPWHDNENDCVQFTLEKMPQHSSANISSDGRLNLTPDVDFSGTINLTIKVEEITCEGKSPILASLSAVKNISIVVQEENDEPDSALVMSDEEVIDPLYNDTIDIVVEANGTGKYVIGSFFLVDVDFNDTLTIITRTDENQTVANFTVTEVKVIPTDLSATGKKNINTAKQVKINYDLLPNFSGIVNYTLVGYDRADFISQPLKIRIFSLNSPCVHGECHQKTNTSLPCTSKQRAYSFDPFICQCQAGYEGQWCEIETDECSTLPCPLLYDCVDRINAYTCNINAGKLMAILVCIAVAIALMVFLCKKFKKKSKVQHFDEFEGDEMNTIEPELLMAKPFREEVPGPSNKKAKLNTQEFNMPETSLFMMKPGYIPRGRAGNKVPAYRNTRLEDEKAFLRKMRWSYNEDEEKLEDKRKCEQGDDSVKETQSDARLRKVKDDEVVEDLTVKKKEELNGKGDPPMDKDQEDFLNMIKESIRGDTKSDLLSKEESNRTEIESGARVNGTTSVNNDSGSMNDSGDTTKSRKSGKTPSRGMAVVNMAYQADLDQTEDQRESRNEKTSQNPSGPRHTVTLPSSRLPEGATSSVAVCPITEASNQSASRPGSGRPGSVASIRSGRPLSAASIELPDINI